MNNKRLEEDLLMAVDAYIALAEQYIVEHEQRITTLASIGRDTTREEQMLVRSNELLKNMHAQRAELLTSVHE